MDALSQKLMKEAEVCLQDGDDDEALRIYDRILELDDVNVEARRSQIRLLIDSERVEDAISALKKLLVVTPKNANTHWSLARQLRKSGRDEQAIESYTRAIDLKPERPHYYVQRSQSLKIVSRHSDALADLKTALELEPENTQYQDAFMQYAVEQCDWSLIVDVARALIAKGFAHSSLRLCFVDALICCGLLDEALEENHSLFEHGSAPSIDISLFEVGLRYVKLSQFRKANDCFKLALSHNPRPAAHGYLNWLQICSLHLDEEEELNQYLSDLLDANPQTFINAASFDDEFVPFLGIGERQEPANPILLNTMPKSGSVYIWRELSRLLGLPLARISKSNWPVDHVIPSWVEAFSHSRSIAQGHFNPHESNFKHLLKNDLRKMIFHIRDPRQATLSWTHHIRSYMERNLRNQFWPPLPTSYEDWSFESQLSWNIEHHLPILCQWITQWDEVFAEKSFEVLFTSYEDFKLDELQYFKNIVSFISHEDIDQEFQPSESFRGRLHFREGKTNEWEGIYSDQQKKQALEFIPDEFLERFSWPA